MGAFPSPVMSRAPSNSVAPPCCAAATIASRPVTIRTLDNRMHPPPSLEIVTDAPGCRFGTTPDKIPTYENSACACGIAADGGGPSGLRRVDESRSRVEGERGQTG